MKYTFLFIAMLALSACDKSATEHNFAPATGQSPDEPSTQLSAEQPSEPTTPENPHDLQALASELSTSDPSALPDVQPLTTADGKIALDKTHILTDTPKADTATYDYLITLDSMAVKNYAKAYDITDKQAQHSMVIAMASPEVLSKILDQLRDGRYIAHQLTDGADMTLVITTTPDVVADKFDYVFADEFGRGLVLPVIIQPKE
ncbi:Uncharacterised protein [Moraxella lacunata]|uniref:Lipoprotein n=1 Tax=Moraxella lacunata TaxID=477 RepID=A0A378QK60_MORLA|nr:hypothetical protein [Moraxella lacunata]STZ01255.1 Uncharacterised protein [Moraxella lacunata]